MNTSTQASHSDRDGLALRSACFPLLTAAVVGTLCSFLPILRLPFVVVGLLVALAWLAKSLAQVVRSVRRRHWLRATSLIAISVAAWPVMAFLMVVGGDYIHLVLAYPYYATHGAVGGGVSKLMDFSWGGTGFAGSGAPWRTLVYDPTDAVASAVGGARVPEEPAVRRSVQHLAGHFYVVEISQ